MRLIFVLLCLLFLCQIIKTDDDFEDLVVEDEDDMDDEEYDFNDEETPEPKKVVPQPDYSVLKEVKGSLMFETFESPNNFKKSWTHSNSKVFPGRFKIGSGSDNNPRIEIENGLYVPQEAQRYAMYGSLRKAFDFSKQKEFVVQYEVRLHETLQCGGAYIKLISSRSGFKPKDITNETPYTVMFGPDKCGDNDKVHFIWKFKNPVSGEYVEHHLNAPPVTVGTTDRLTHIYTLIVRSDNSYEVFIDQESKKKGSLLTDFDPPINPPAEIDDPEDSKPEAWVDDARIPDPEATKPEDWDEDAPRTIIDPEAEKPDDWLNDEPLEIPDPNASIPEDWDEEDDGEWEAPIVPNPLCEEVSGCGEWSAPDIPNPDYKGKWYPPMIENPDYIGEWTPKQIPNPNFFEESNPYAHLDAVSGVGIDIWTMQRGIEYDNIYVGTSADAAYEIAENWKIRHEYEKHAMNVNNPDVDEDDFIANIIRTIMTYPFEIIVAIAVIVFSIIYFCCCGNEDRIEDRVETAVEAEEEEEEEEEDKEQDKPKKRDPANKASNEDNKK